MPRLALLCLGSGVAALLALAASAAATGGSPLRPGQPEGSDVPAALFLAAAGGALALYLLALVVLHARGGRVRLVFAFAVVIQLLPLAGPLLLSRDVYAYWAYGRLVAVHEANPYAVAPERYPDDPAVRAMAGGWRRQESVYGPVFSTASAGLARVTGRSPEAAALAYRLLAALGVLAATALAAHLALRTAFAAAFVGWNPLLALDFAGGGHNDVWMAVLVLGALALGARGRPRLAGLCWALAGGLKWVALALLPLRLLAARGREARRTTAGFLAGAGSVATGAFLAFGVAWLSALLPFSHRHARYALPSRLAQLGLDRTLAAVLAFALLALALAWLARSARAGRERLGLACAFLLLASPWLLPWYAAWAVPLAATEEDATAWVLVLALCAYLLPDRVPL